MALYHEDIQDIELNNGTISRSFASHIIGEGDNAANRYGVRLFRNGEPVMIGGSSCIGYFIRGGHNDTVVINGGTFTGNEAYIELPQACYAYEGNFSLVIKLAGTGITGTMRIVDGTVAMTTTETQVDPGSVIPDIGELLALVDELEDLEDTLDGAVNRYKVLYLINKSTRTQQFELSSTQVSSGVFTYTLTTKNTYAIRGVTDIDYDNYVLSYSQGSGNVGVSETEYYFDDTIVGTSVTGFAAFVADRSDYTLKIVPALSVTNDQRVIALFYGTGGTLNNSFTTWGSNGILFSAGKKGINRMYVASLSSGDPEGALTWSYDASNVYTITRNKDNFGAFGFTDVDKTTQIGIGSNSSGVTYPFPSSFSSASGISGFAVIVATVADTTTSTWKIISMGDLEGAEKDYIILGYIYKNNGIFFTERAEAMFTNFLKDNAGGVSQRMQEAVYWYSRIHNVIAPIKGKVIYDPVNYTVTLDHMIMAPTSMPGNFDLAFSEQSIVLDWSSESNPTYLRSIYYNALEGEFIVLNKDSDDVYGADDLRKMKRGLSLVCMVYNGKYVYTCGAAQPGMWFINDRDIYAGGSTGGGDLHRAFKKVGVIGDSLSVGYMNNKDAGTATSRMLAYSWPKAVMKDAGVPWLNLGTSGQNVLTWCSNETYGKAQAEASGNKCQAYIIGLGENDQSTGSRGVPLGTPSDISSDYTVVATTYYGGYARIIEILKHLNADCKIFCLTNPRTGGNRASYNTAVRYIADTYFASDDNVILVDLANDYPDQFNGSSFLPSDNEAIEGGHYSAEGYVRIAGIIEKAVSDAMEANVASMYDIAFIPYDTGDPTPNTMTE